VTEPTEGLRRDSIEVVPVVVLSQVFTARPSSIPDIRDFVRRCLAESPLTEEGNREVGETVFRALLDAAGPTGSIQVAFRIFPEHVEVDVLHSDTALSPQTQPGPPVAYAAPPRAAGPPQPAGASQSAAGPQSPMISGLAGDPRPRAADVLEPAAAEGSAAPPAAARAGLGADASVPVGQPGHPTTFAEWMSSALRREGLTQEAAARQLGVSVKTVSRWVGGATEPRMRDLRRIQEVFGAVPLP
jgi:DNA-binding XRE family transcriptional regulator